MREIPSAYKTEQGAFNTSWGLMFAIWQNGVLYSLSLPAKGEKNIDKPEAGSFLWRLAAEVEEYFAGKRKAFSIPYFIPQAPDFYSKIWRQCAKIPYGEIISYGELAALGGNPKAARAAGGAMGNNPLPLLVPCHRVVGAKASLGGFSRSRGGAALELKKRLLNLEGHNF